MRIKDVQLDFGPRLRVVYEPWVTPAAAERELDEDLRAEQTVEQPVRLVWPVLTRALALRVLNGRMRAELAWHLIVLLAFYFVVTVFFAICSLVAVPIAVVGTALSGMTKPSGDEW